MTDTRSSGGYEAVRKPLSELRNAVVWCYCDEYDAPMPTGPWVFPDDEHADTCGAREWVDLARVKAWMDCPHLSWSGDEGPIATLGRFPTRWRCDGCGEVMTDA